MRQFLTVKAIIRSDTRILLCPSPEGLTLPGGKVDSNNTVAAALSGHIKEMTNLDVTAAEPFFVTEWFGHIPEEHWRIVGIFFVCDATIAVVKDGCRWIDSLDYEKHALSKPDAEACRQYVQKYNS